MATSLFYHNLFPEMPDDLIDKLAPYLGKRGLEAAQALKEMPLEITWYDADLLSKAVMRYWAKYYANIYDESVKCTFTSLYK